MPRSESAQKAWCSAWGESEIQSQTARCQLQSHVRRALAVVVGGLSLRHLVMRLGLACQDEHLSVQALTCQRE